MYPQSSRTRRTRRSGRETRWTATGTTCSSPLCTWAVRPRPRPAVCVWHRALADPHHPAGWYDIFQQWQLNAWNQYNTQGRGLAPGYQYLVMVPQGHCAKGQVRGARGCSVARRLR